MYVKWHNIWLTAVMCIMCFIVTLGTIKYMNRLPPAESIRLIIDEAYVLATDSSMSYAGATAKYDTKYYLQSPDGYVYQGVFCGEIARLPAGSKIRLEMVQQPEDGGCHKLISLRVLEYPKR